MRAPVSLTDHGHRRLNQIRHGSLCCSTAERRDPGTQAGGQDCKQHVIRLAVAHAGTPTADRVSPRVETLGKRRNTVYQSKSKRAAGAGRESDATFTHCPTINIGWTVRRERRVSAFFRPPRAHHTSTINNPKTTTRRVGFSAPKILLSLSLLP